MEYVAIATDPWILPSASMWTRQKELCVCVCGIYIRGLQGNCLPYNCKSICAVHLALDVLLATAVARYVMQAISNHCNLVFPTHA